MSSDLLYISSFFQEDLHKIREVRLIKAEGSVNFRKPLNNLEEDWMSSFPVVQINPGVILAQLNDYSGKIHKAAVYKVNEVEKQFQAEVMVDNKVYKGTNKWATKKLAKAEAAMVYFDTHNITYKTS